MFSPALEVILNIAFREAISRGHAYLTLEHLLYALAHDPDGERILAACGADLPQLRRDLDTYLDEGIERQRRGSTEKLLMSIVRPAATACNGWQSELPPSGNAAIAMASGWTPRTSNVSAPTASRARRCCTGGRRRPSLRVRRATFAIGRAFNAER